MIIELYSNDNQQTNNFASDYLKKNHFGKIISLDVGKKRIGIAVCDENRLICTPKLIINRFSNLQDIASIKNIIDNEKISFMIVGMPLNQNKNNQDAENEMSNFIKNFVKKIDDYFENSFIIFLIDESFSSFEARRIIKNNKNKARKFYDDISASIILEGFIRQYLNF